MMADTTGKLPDMERDETAAGRRRPICCNEAVRKVLRKLSHASSIDTRLIGLHHFHYSDANAAWL